MEVQLHVYGSLKYCVPKRFREHRTKFEFESPITVYRLLVAVLNITTLDATVLINGKIANAAQVIKDGDDVRVFSPIAGG